MNQALHDELLRLQDDDQRVRGEYLHCPAPDDGPRTLGILDAMLHVDARNAARFSVIVTKYGWPGRSLAGEDGCRAAWILAQHNSWHEELLQRCLELLDAAVAAGEAPLVYAEQLRDTVYRSQGKTYLSPLGKILPGGVGLRGGGSAPDFEWKQVDGVVEPGSHVGAEANRALRNVFEIYEDFSVKAEEYIDAGDTVLVVARARGTARGSGLQIDQRWTFVWTVRDGRPVGMEQHPSREAALKAVGLEE
jgi:ketosteroid isomerase-like protein